MPIYLVRWPDLAASLVRAQDDDELIDILDQVANPEGCEWSVYDGPLFIDFQLPVEWSIREKRSPTIAQLLRGVRNWYVSSGAVASHPLCRRGGATAIPRSVLRLRQR